ncbi:hypothetical protein [Paenibacillus taichungensis]
MIRIEKISPRQMTDKEEAALIADPSTLVLFRIGRYMILLHNS